MQTQTKWKPQTFALKLKCHKCQAMNRVNRREHQALKATVQIGRSQYSHSVTNPRGARAIAPARMSLTPKIWVGSRPRATNKKRRRTGEAPTKLPGDESTQALTIGQKTSQKTWISVIMILVKLKMTEGSRSLPFFMWTLGQGQIFTSLHCLPKQLPE